MPYVTHLLAVATIVGENGGTEDEVIAALLHDAIEDQGGAATREETRKRFGDTVVTIVDGTSDKDVVPKPPWRERSIALGDEVEVLDMAPDEECEREMFVVVRWKWESLAVPSSS